METKKPDRESYLYGLWEVFTEGDCEGHSRVSLGVFEGTVLDIAITLSNKQYCTLRFKEVVIQKIGLMSESLIKRDILDIAFEYDHRIGFVELERKTLEARKAFESFGFKLDSFYPKNIVILSKKE